MAAWQVTTPAGRRLLDCGSCVVQLLQASGGSADLVEDFDEQKLERCPR